MASLIHHSHGWNIDSVSPDWPAMNNTDIGTVLEHYNQAGKLCSRLWRSPRPFSCAELIETDNNSLFIKRYHQRIRSVKALEEEHHFIKHLATRGIPVPGLYQTDDGHSAVSLNGWTYELQNKASGTDTYRNTRSWESFRSQEDAYSAGKMLARLHHAAHDYKAPSRQDVPLIANLRLFSKKDPIKAIQYHISTHEGLASYLQNVSWQQEIEKHLLPWQAHVQPYLEYQAPLWTHNDWHASNLLWMSSTHGSEVASVIDFGLSDKTFALFDIATAIERNTIPWLSIESYNPTTTYLHIDSFLSGYIQQRQLTEIDFYVLSWLLPIVHADFALSELDYFVNILQKKTYADLAWHDYFLGHARWFSLEHGNNLLSYIRAAVPLNNNHGDNL